MADGTLLLVVGLTAVMLVATGWWEKKEESRSERDSISTKQTFQDEDPLAIERQPNGLQGFTTEEQKIVALTTRFLKRFMVGGYEFYKTQTVPNLTCFIEPDFKGSMIDGHGVHRFWLERMKRKFASLNQKGGQTNQGPMSNFELINPRVHMIGSDGAVIAYTKILQIPDPVKTVMLEVSTETVIWKFIGDSWKMIHFHRCRVE